MSRTSITAGANAGEPHRGLSRCAQAAGVSLMFCFAAAGGAQPAAWKPEKNVEIIVGASPGGTLDKMGRTIQRILQERRMLEASSTVVNKAGGGGNVGWTYLSQHPGDGHYLAVGSATLLTNHITGKSAFNYTDFTTVAVLSSEYVAFVVKTDSPIQSGRDLAARLRKDPAAASIAVSTSAGNTSHIAAALVGRTAGADARKMKIVVFNSGGDSMTALLGGHIDVVTISAAGAVPQAQAGKVRIIGLAAARRLHGALAEVPTWKEQGIDVVVDNFRSLKGPRGMSPAQIAYWEEVAAKLVNTDEWKTEVDRNFRAMNYMRSKESRTYLEAQYRELRAVLVELGLAKQAGQSGRSRHAARTPRFANATRETT